MNDPYKILGVARDASDEEIKKAYRELARKYHPDNYMNNPLSDLVTEKMKEVNEAYDQIQKIRSGKMPGVSTGRSNGRNPFSEVRVLINAGRFQVAELMLERMPPSMRGAEWSFLKGLILTKKGYFHDAQAYFDRAATMEPSNHEYTYARDELRRTGSESAYKTRRRGCGCSCCDLCSGLACADCCCECLGGRDKEKK